MPPDPISSSLPMEWERSEFGKGSLFVKISRDDQGLCFNPPAAPEILRQLVSLSLVQWKWPSPDPLHGIWPSLRQQLFFRPAA